MISQSMSSPSSPVVTPAVREPYWAVLAHDINWLGLWSSSESAVVKEIARLESRLHNPVVTDHLELIAVRARLDAYRWLRETVTALAEKANAREIDDVAAVANAAVIADNAQRRSRWRRAVDSVLPPVLG